MSRDAQAIAGDPRTQESQRRARIEAVVQVAMRDLSDDGIHHGTVIDDFCLEAIAAVFRSVISKAENGAFR